MLDTNEDKCGLGFLVVGLVMLGWDAFSSPDAVGTGLMLGIYVAYVVISVLAGVAAAFLTAAILGTSFGLFGSAVMRLAGIIVFTSAIPVIIPYGGLLSLVVYIVLLMWLFELEFFEVIVFTLILWAMRFLVGILLVIMLAAAVGAVGAAAG